MEFKVGDKVKLPKQKSIGIELEDSEPYKIAVKNKQDYMYIVEIIKHYDDNYVVADNMYIAYDDIYVVADNMYRDGDYYIKEELELYEEEKQKINISIELCNENAVLPTYAREGDAGMDIYAVEDTIIPAGRTKIIHTGLKVAIPEGYEIQVRPRSGLSLKSPLRVANSPGTIDAGYRDEIGVIMTNTDSIHSFTINKGDRIAQMVLQEVPRINWEVVNSVANIGENRGGGFGSSGIK